VAATSQSQRGDLTSTASSLNKLASSLSVKACRANSVFGYASLAHEMGDVLVRARMHFGSLASGHGLAKLQAVALSTENLKPHEKYSRSTLERKKGAAG
jgi:hypothetical protein